MAFSPSTNAQEKTKPAADIDRMVRDGMVEALDSRFAGGRTLEELQLLAQAATNKASKAKDDKQRQSAFEDAEKRYDKYVAAAAKTGQESEQKSVAAAAARLEFANMILAKWVSPDLDELELSNEKKGDARRAIGLLLKARKLYDAAQHDIEPLGRKLDEQRGEVEDRYLEMGIFEAIPRVRLDVRFNLAWANYYLARFDAKSIEQRAESLGVAERLFREMIDSGQTGESAARCRLGLACSLRELGKYADAEPAFEAALADAGASPLAAQIRYEKARAQIAAGKFDDARKTLAPLVSKNLDDLPAADRPARFYIHLAYLWDAYSFILESDLHHNARARETGMARLNQLSARGGPWPALVGTYIASTVKPDADPKTLTPGELLFSGRQFYDEKKYGSALARLNEATSRKDLSPELLGELLFEIGLCNYQLKEQRAAADAFGKLATTLKTHAKAAQAAVYAYQLCSTIADESKERDDYLKLADALSSFLTNFSKHEKRDEALWWLPVAYQSGGEYAKAIEHFEQVPVATARWEEAQYRKAMCARLLFETQRESMSEAERANRANKIADDLATCAKSSLQRADQSRDPKQTRKWSAAACVTAAELRTSSAVGQFQAALAALSDFESRYPDSEQIGRVLAVRIAAYRGLRQFDEAAKVVEQYLQTVPAGQAGGVLATVARGMQDEVERLQKDGRTDDAGKLARDATQTFEQLETWAKADPSRASHLDAILYGLARMYTAAGQAGPAQTVISKLVEKDPRNGAYQRLLAETLTVALTADAPPEQIAAARTAWESILRDPALRSSQPDAYWEARYNFLSLVLREGRATEVEKAIRQEEIWYPELGGPQWRAKLIQLRDKAATP